jgi:hypothetical protein
MVTIGQNKNADHDDDDVISLVYDIIECLARLRIQLPHVSPVSDCGCDLNNDVCHCELMLSLKWNVDVHVTKKCMFVYFGAPSFRNMFICYPKNENRVDFVVQKIVAFLRE